MENKKFFVENACERFRFNAKIPRHDFARDMRRNVRQQDCLVFGEVTIVEHQKELRSIGLQSLN